MLLMGFTLFVSILTFTSSANGAAVTAVAVSDELYFLMRLKPSCSVVSCSSSVSNNSSSSSIGVMLYFVTKCSMVMATSFLDGTGVKIIVDVIYYGISPSK